MENTATLAAESRTKTGKGAARKLRAAGRVPANVYGETREAHSISVDALELDRLFAGISIENTVVELSIDEAKPIRVLVRETQAHPFRPEILHVDFYQVRAGERVSVEVPLVLTGTPVGVLEGGVLDQIQHEVAVSCVVDRIPEEIEVDISELAIGDTIYVGDLDFPEGVESELEEDRVICSVTPPTVEALEEPTDEPVEEAAEPELIGAEEVDEES